MTDPGLVAALGIEAVEWLDEASDRVTVRISGRWRRRPTATGQPWLVLESHGERNRFPAMPEPPGLTGTAPGTWRMTFRLPGELSRAPDVRAWLQLGAVLVPLPAEPIADPIAEPAAGPTVEPIPPALEPRAVGLYELEEAARDEQLREAERALEAERARTTAAEAAAADLASRVAELGHELERREADVARLGATLADREHSLRTTRQQAHAEEMVRLELVRESDRVREMLEASRRRVRRLEDELVALRRRADEAEHLAAAARRMRPPEPPPPPPEPEALKPEREPLGRDVDRVLVYAAERELIQIVPSAGAAPAPRRLPARPMWSVRERELVAVRARRTTPAGGAHLAATLEALRSEMSDLRAIAEREREGRAGAEAIAERLRRQLADQESRAARAFAALDDLRDQIEWVRRAYEALSDPSGPPGAPPPDPPAADPAPPAADPDPAPPPPARDPAPAASSNGGLEPGRLEAARTRLREQTPALPDEDAPPATHPDSRPPFTLAPVATRDPEQAGRLLMTLLPAQGLVHPAELAYDLILDPTTCVRVTVADQGATDVRWMHTSRTREEVRFQLEGDPASIVRLLTAGPLRRRFRRRRLARVNGDRLGLDALHDLLTARLLAADLERVGVRLEALDAGGESPNRATSG